ncbi:MAG: hybrid sensor histidine kinase/response regulator [Polaromonas sp.]|nr:hybrid sensor histidine kinase/response regulator [Polaromonas sp.]
MLPFPTDTAKILIVDDLPENLLALDALIRQEGRIICRADSGEAALALMLEHEFALAILDVQMPGINGLELAGMMRSTAKTRSIPIVFVSAAGREMNYAFAGYESGAIDFLYQPLDSHAVRSKVSAFVEMYRQRKQQEFLLHELQTTQAQLQRAVQVRDDFMSMASHELRTPLNTLLLQAQLRRRLAGGATLAPEKIQAMVERDEQQIRNIMRLIDDMLDVSRMQRGTLDIAPAPSDLAGLVRRTIESHADQAAAVGCTLELSAPDALPGLWDEFRIEQVVANLLTNAVRYGNGKPVQVEVASEPAAGEARVSVRDQGIGIAPEDHARIFNQFERAVGKQVAPGLGLGLFISRQIAHAHGGRIEVKSALGEGSTFSLRLPLVGQQ